MSQNVPNSKYIVYLESNKRKKLEVEAVSMIEALYKAKDYFRWNGEAITIRKK